MYERSQLIKDVVFELLEARCQIQDESEGELRVPLPSSPSLLPQASLTSFGSFFSQLTSSELPSLHSSNTFSCVSAFLDRFSCTPPCQSEAKLTGPSSSFSPSSFQTETLEISPLSTTDLRSYITSYLDLLSPLAPPHPPPSSRQLHSAAPQRSDGSLLDIGYLLGGYSRTSLGGTGRNRLEEDELATGTRAPSTEMETRRVMGYLRDARWKVSEAEMKIVDLEEGCERLQLTADGYGRDWEERDMEAAGRTKYGSGSEAFGGSRSSEYVTRTEERSGSRYSLEEKGKQVRLCLVARLFSLDASRLLTLMLLSFEPDDSTYRLPRQCRRIHVELL